MFLLVTDTLTSTVLTNDLSMTLSRSSRINFNGSTIDKFLNHLLRLDVTTRAVTNHVT